MQRIQLRARHGILFALITIITTILRFSRLLAVKPLSDVIVQTSYGYRNYCPTSTTVQERMPLTMEV